MEWILLATAAPRSSVAVWLRLAGSEPYFTDAVTELFVVNTTVNPVLDRFVTIGVLTPGSSVAAGRTRLRAVAAPMAAAPIFLCPESANGMLAVACVI
jgi:hypothetical protein